MDSINVACGFLGGTILSTPGGYRVLQHPRPARVFKRIADARWFLALNWCNQCPTPAGVLTHEGQLTFINKAALEMGETAFLPLEHRRAIFTCCRPLASGEVATYELPTVPPRQLEVLGVDIDPRYGKVAVIRTLPSRFEN